MTNIFQQLTKLSEERGLSLAAVAKKAGVPIRTLWDWRNKLPRTLQHYENLMKTLGDYPKDEKTDKDQPDQPTPPNKP